MRSSLRPEGIRRLGRILVALDPAHEDSEVLARAGARARRGRALPPLLCVAAPVPAWIWCAPQLPEHPGATAAAAASECLRRAVAAVPRDMSVVTRLAHGRPAAALRDELSAGGHDAVVAGARLAAALLSRRRLPHPGGMRMSSSKGRVVFLIRLRPGAEADFLTAYESIRHEVAGGVAGHRVDQVCRLRDDPDRWLITSEWETLERFLDWERSDGHRELAAPLRACIAEAQSLKFDVVAETSASEARS
jgi:heme-degrading monooxygenase HmoA/nucleotide-binding universal stress UspA family protein